MSIKRQEATPKNLNCEYCDKVFQIQVRIKTSEKYPKIIKFINFRKIWMFIYRYTTTTTNA